MQGLSGLRVVEHASAIAGPYAGKLFADAGAEVVKLEPPEGDPLRRGSAPGPATGDAGLFRYLNASKRSVVGRLAPRPGAAPAVERLLAGADLLIEDLPPVAWDRGALRRRRPGLVILSLTPFGLTGAMSGRPATDFILQAESGSIGSRARPGGEPYQAGGRIVEWAGGCFAAVAALAAVRRARQSGHGGHVDLSLLEVAALISNSYLDLMWSLLGNPPVAGAFSYVETPSIEPTRDGYVGFTTYAPAQLAEFLSLIGRDDLRASGAFDPAPQRLARLAEWEAIVHAWTRTHTTDEIVAAAQHRRIPVAPICNGRTLLEHPQVRARGVFHDDPSGGFLRPRPPYRIDGEPPPPPRPAPRLGEHTGFAWPGPPERPAPRGDPDLPLAGLRVLDATTWWAGPIATWMLALLGADVIHLESVGRLDGSRSVGAPFAGMHPAWWESSFVFLSANAGKRGLTLDLGDPRGQQVLEALIAGADALVENFSPRVMDGFGLSWERVQALGPRCHYVRMPAFGLDGPWREHVGFASTMEQMSGMAWLTGHPDDQPRVQRGPCDPLAGMHAAFALLVAMAERDHDGRGHFVECSMLEGALNVTAEQVIEWTGRGHLMQRQGNRSPEAAPQGLYACRGHDVSESPRWLALSVADEAQWHALVRWLGAPAWATRVGADLASRRAEQDVLDAALRRVFAERDRDACLAELVAAGVPAAPVVDPRALSEHPQLVARGFLETIEHPVVGRAPTMAAPFRLAGVDRWLARAAPTLGEHNAEVLRELGWEPAAIAALEQDGVIGFWPAGVSKTEGGS